MTFATFYLAFSLSFKQVVVLAGQYLGEILCKLPNNATQRDYLIRLLENCPCVSTKFVLRHFHTYLIYLLLEITGLSVHFSPCGLLGNAVHVVLVS